MNHSFKTIIVDDEPAARRLIAGMLAPYSWIRIIGEAMNGEGAVDLINRMEPDLVFLDIHLPDMNGFDVLEQIGNHPYVIFTTAYEQYALRAFESFSIDDLLKPVREERMARALEKLQHFGKPGFLPPLEELRSLAREMNSPAQPLAFPLRQGDRILLFPFNQIAYFEADDKYVFLHTGEGKKFLADQTLTELETRLPSQFMRVQKSYIINRDMVEELHKHFNGRLLLVLKDKVKTRILSDQTYYGKLKDSFRL